ncbi:MAG: 16S rRNA (guanine(966)-N(2))-methyltransferase RsmD [Nitrospirota bacterium]
MRISGGESKGRRIAPPPRSRSTGHGGVRPTSDKVREALFSILGQRVADAVFLELFAGTGAVGIEALSRGASRAVLVDSSERSARLIRENLESLGYRERAAVVAKDVLVFLKKTVRELGPYDIVFADPPYHKDFITPPPSPSYLKRGIKETDTESAPDFLKILGGEELSGALPEGALIAYEHFKKNPAPENIGRLAKKKDYLYGDTVVSLYTVTLTSSKS